MKICIIIPVHNGLHDTLQCLESLEPAINQDEHTILVVNNGSADGTASAIAERFPFVQLLTNPSNQSFAKSVNQGAKYAWRNGAEAILLLNNDTVVTKNFLVKLVDGLKSDAVIGMVSPLILYYDKPEIIWYNGGRVELNRGRIYHERIGRNKDEAYSGFFGYATGCCVLIAKRCFEQVCGFDERFSFYGEDVDFSIRARKARWWIACEKESEIYHRISASSTTLRKMRMKLAGEARLLWKHNNAKERPRAFAGFVVFNLWRLLKKIYAILR